MAWDRVYTITNFFIFWTMILVANYMMWFLYFILHNVVVLLLQLITLQQLLPWYLQHLWCKKWILKCSTVICTIFVQKKDFYYPIIDECEFYLATNLVYQTIFFGRKGIWDVMGLGMLVQLRKLGGGRGHQISSNPHSPMVLKNHIAKWGRNLVLS